MLKVQLTSSPIDTETTTKVISFSESKVVKIVDQFRNGVLNVEAEVFKPRTNSGLKANNLEADEVVEIIKDCRPINNLSDRSIRVEASSSRANQKTSFRQPEEIIEEYNEINANCAENLQKEFEVKPSEKTR